MRFTVKNVDPRTICRLAQEYLAERYISFKALAERHGVSNVTISDILWRGIAENILDENTANQVFAKIVNKPSKGWYQRKLRWEKAFEARNECKTVIKKNAKKSAELLELEQLRDYYENAIQSYESFFFDEDGAPSLETLKEKLAEINRKIKAVS